MLIPSIDLMDGQIVQLVQGEKLKLAFDDFDYWIERFSKYPLVQLIDLDAAMRQGDNRALIEMICKRLPCQVGGGLSSPKTASACSTPAPSASSTARPSSAQQGVDKAFAARSRKRSAKTRSASPSTPRTASVAVKGWKDSVDLTPEEAVTWLEDYCAAFLYTHVDTEGTMQGFPMDVAAILRATTARQLIVAGGIKEQPKSTRSTPWAWMPSRAWPSIQERWTPSGGFRCDAVSRCPDRPVSRSTPCAPAP